MSSVLNYPNFVEYCGINSWISYCYFCITKIIFISHFNFEWIFSDRRSKSYNILNEENADTCCRRSIGRATTILTSACAYTAALVNTQMQTTISCSHSKRQPGKWKMAQLNISKPSRFLTSESLLDLWIDHKIEINCVQRCTIFQNMYYFIRSSSTFLFKLNSNYVYYELRPGVKEVCGTAGTNGKKRRKLFSPDSTNNFGSLFFLSRISYSFPLSQWLQPGQMQIIL